MNTDEDTDLFEAFPLAFVIPHERLVIETVDLDRHRLNVLREREHRRQRLIVEKLHARWWISRHFKRRRPRERETPQSKTRHRRVIRPDIETCGFKSADNAPVRIASEHR